VSGGGSVAVSESGGVSVSGGGSIAVSESGGVSVSGGGSVAVSGCDKGNEMASSSTEHAARQRPFLAVLLAVFHSDVTSRRSPTIHRYRSNDFHSDVARRRSSTIQRPFTAMLPARRSPTIHRHRSNDLSQRCCEPPFVNDPTTLHCDVASTPFVNDPTTFHSDVASRRSSTIQRPFTAMLRAAVRQRSNDLSQRCCQPFVIDPSTFHSDVVSRR
jgi:hypothetical protein